MPYPLSEPPTSWLKGGGVCSLTPGSRLQGAAQRRNLGGYIVEPGLYLPAKERALDNIFLKKSTGRRREAGTSGTAANTFWLAARRATEALEVVKMVAKVSPGALRPNRTLFSVSLPTRVGRPH